MEESAGRDLLAANGTSIGPLSSDYPGVESLDLARA